MGKKITVSLSIILICTFTFINGYTYVYPSFADSSTDNWNNVTTNQELSEAFRYYCKSRNLAIEGSVLDALTKFTTNNFNTICNTLGIDITALQAHLKRSTDSNGKVQFLFDQFGVTAYNRIFAEFLQNNDLTVGDSADEQNNTLYSGIYATIHGYTCLMYIVDANGNTGNYQMNISANKIQFGSPYMYTNNELLSLIGTSGSSKQITYYTSNYNSVTMYGRYDYGYYGISKSLPVNPSNTPNQILKGDGFKGDLVLWRPVGWSDPNTCYFGMCQYNGGTGKYLFYQIELAELGNKQNAIIFLTTNNKVINNNTYNDNRQTVINNEGDVYNYSYDNEDPPIDPPPSTSTPPTNSGGTDGDISFPNFDFQLPQIDWSLGDLSEKFPFSIPFDLIAFFTVLNAEPQAPSIDANIPLGSWYTWHFQADFSQFNNWASIIRNVEFIAFCISLIYLTIRLVKG